jgi:hypothetical protein
LAAEPALFVPALKVVGDRYELEARQRVAVARCACSDDQQRQIRDRQVSEIRERELWIDAFNVLTSIEAALSGGVILVARDGCYRDMASMHGTYRTVEETLPAVGLLGELLSLHGPLLCRWFLDQPVSNSGRLKSILRQIALDHSWNWHVEVVPDPDPVLLGASEIVATADSQILNGARLWFNLARLAIGERVPDAWIVDLSGCPSSTVQSP